MRALRQKVEGRQGEAQGGQVLLEGLPQELLIGTLLGLRLEITRCDPVASGCHADVSL